MCKKDRLCCKLLENHSGQAPVLARVLRGLRSSDDGQELADDQEASLTDSEIERLSNEFAEDILELGVHIAGATKFKFIKRLYQSRRKHNKRLRGFRRRLQRHWGPGLESMQCLRELCVEAGAEVWAVYGEGLDMPRHWKLQAITQLHARACQIADECTCLLHAGFPDGAMARWRAMHECAVIGAFLFKNDEDVSKRFLEHHVVERLKAARELLALGERSGLELPREEDIDALEGAVAALCERYGKGFRENHGWIGDQLGGGRIGLKHIEQNAGLDHLRPYFRMSSWGVHVGPNSLRWSLAQPEWPPVALLVGPTNSGLADPVQCVAITLAQITTWLLQLNPSVDSIVLGKIIMSFRDQTIEEIMESHWGIDEKDVTIG